MLVISPHDRKKAVSALTKRGAQEIPKVGVDHDGCTVAYNDGLLRLVRH
jgi:hypothetical protein